MSPPNGNQVYDPAPSSGERSGRKRVRARVEVLAVVDERDPRIDADPPREVPAGDCARRLQGPLGGVDHGPDPHVSSDHGIQVRVVPGLERVGRRASASGLWSRRSTANASPVEVVSSPAVEHRHQLVAQLHVGHRPAVLVARAKQQRQHVVALVEVGLPARAGRSPRTGASPPRRRGGAEPRPGWSARVAPEGLGHEEEGLGVDHRQHRRRRRSTRSGSYDAEHRPGVIVNVRWRIRSRTSSSAPGATGRPRPRRPRGSSAASRSACALERRQQQLALAQVLGPVQHQHGVVAQHPRQRRVCLARVEVGLIPREQLADRRPARRRRRRSQRPGT